MTLSIKKYGLGLALLCTALWLCPTQGEAITPQEKKAKEDHFDKQLRIYRHEQEELGGKIHQAKKEGKDPKQLEKIAKTFGEFIKDTEKEQQNLAREPEHKEEVSIVNLSQKEIEGRIERFKGRVSRVENGLSELDQKIEQATKRSEKEPQDYYGIATMLHERYAEVETLEGAKELLRKNEERLRQIEEGAPKKTKDAYKKPGSSN